MMVDFKFDTALSDIGECGSTLYVGLSYIYIYPYTRESQISMVLVSVGLASLAQLIENTPTS